MNEEIESEIVGLVFLRKGILHGIDCFVHWSKTVGLVFLPKGILHGIECFVHWSKTLGLLFLRKEILHGIYCFVQWTKHSIPCKIPLRKKTKPDIRLILSLFGTDIAESNQWNHENPEILREFGSRSEILKNEQFWTLRDFGTILSILPQTPDPCI